MTTLFVADLHLSADRPARVRDFLSLLSGPARQADRLYILGDLFDQWLGDDDDTAPYPAVESALRTLATAGTPVQLMHGNHDFTLGAGFADRTGCRLIPDPSVVDVFGERVLLMHGDTLCTDDVDYQRFRANVRAPRALEDFLNKPLTERRDLVTELRQQTRRAVAEKPLEIMDVNDDAVRAALRDHEVRYLVHGHTHRPAVHSLELDGKRTVRIVLGDWYRRSHVLVWTDRGFIATEVERLLEQDLHDIRNTME